MIATGTARQAKLYVRKHPRHDDSVEILHLTVYPDTVWGVHFYGSTATAPPDLFSADPHLDALVEGDQLHEGDFDPPEGLDGFHNLITARNGDGAPFFGGGWTLLPDVAEQPQ